MGEVRETPYQVRVKNFLACFKWSTENEYVLLRQLAALHAWFSSWEPIANAEDLPTVRTVLESVSPRNPILRRFLK